MGKSNKQAIGRALIKSMKSSRSRKPQSKTETGYLHTTDLQDGYDWGRLNLQSVTEESSFHEFLSTAELAGTEFKAEKLNVKFVIPGTEDLLTQQEKDKIRQLHKTYQNYLKIPRRPQWTEDMTAEELHVKERESFLQWRKALSILQENDSLVITPYEKNLEFWRQLWRVIEFSNVLVQIVDARNPLLFRCEDLEKYVKEISEDKINIILLNKADFLTKSQRQAWCDYFNEKNIRVVFYSALDVLNTENSLEGSGNEEDDKNLDVEEAEETDTASENEESDKGSEEKSENVENLTNSDNVKPNEEPGPYDSMNERLQKNYANLIEIQAQLEELFKEYDAKNQLKNSKNQKSSDNQKTVKFSFTNTPQVYNRDQLIEYFKSLNRLNKPVFKVGFIGYPNVGKSSTINSLMQRKKVSVSATPGKTKHFQTLYVEEDLMLVDCPGLVMPSFIATKSQLFLNGILSINEMRHNHMGPINILVNDIPKEVFEEKYGIMLPIVERKITAEELLNSLGFNRGFMTANGQPDQHRAARLILKDYITGSLLFCYAPPGVEQNEFHTFPECQKKLTRKLDDVTLMRPQERRAIKQLDQTAEDIDKEFFQPRHSFHTKGVKGIELVKSGTNAEASAKPWKKYNKHANKNKKEKLRRVYDYLDQH